MSVILPSTTGPESNGISVMGNFLYRKPTLKMLAREAGVSTATASLVINGRAEAMAISAKTREHVLKIADKIGYIANPTARGLAGKDTKSIGLIYSFSGPYKSGRAVRSFTQTAMGAAYVPYLIDSMSDPAVIAKMLKELSERCVDGVVLESIPGSVANNPMIADLLKRFSGAVIISDEVHKEWPDQVVIEPRPAFETMIGHLNAIGRERVVFLGNQETNQMKATAILDVWNRIGRDMKNLRFVDLKEDVEEGEADPVYAVLEKVAWKDEKWDSLICATDNIAAISINWFRSLDLKVPKDIAVTGFNDTPVARFFYPPVASVNRREKEAITIATRFLLNRLAKREMAPQIAQLDMSFIWRESAGLLNAGKGRRGRSKTSVMK